jgi:hypothetical protein
VKNLLLLLAATAFSLAVAEGVARLLTPEQLGFVYTGEGFRNPLGFEKRLPRELTRNAWGFHDAEVAPRGDRHRVVLLGDSYVAAESVDLDQTVGQRLEHHLNAASDGRWDVVALGRPGWGLSRELEALRRFGAEVAPDVVLTVFLSLNDPIDDSPELRMRRTASLLEKVGDGVLEGDLATLRPRYLWIESSVLNQWISHRLSLRLHRSRIPISYQTYAVPLDDAWQAAWKRLEDLVIETQQASEALGARYALVSASTPFGVLGREAGLARLRALYPGMSEGQWDLDQPDRRMAALCARHGIPFLALEPGFREETARGAVLHWPLDGHWNVAGNDRAGARLAELVVALGVGSDPRAGAAP